MSKNETAEKILQLIQEEAIVQFPIFPEAFGLLQTQSCVLQDAALGTDGVSLFFDADAVCKLFQENTALLRWTYLHTMLHVLFDHPQAAAQSETASVQFSADLKKICTADQLADLEVTCLALLLTKETSVIQQPYFAAPESVQRLFEHLRVRQSSGGQLYLSPFEDKSDETEQSVSSAESFCPSSSAKYGLLKTDLQDLLSCISCDSHENWRKTTLNKNLETARVTAAHSSKTASTQRNPFLEKEMIKKKILAKAGEQAGSGSGKHGSGTGGIEEDALLEQRKSLDYSSFLRRFTIAREEAVLDLDSFDYIPYHYGLTHYGNLPFIEPLEYKEVNRLDELAIAIDTSGSCSGLIVRRFLEETWNILRQKENFFSKMRLHLIQCDCMIQEHRIFTSAAEFEEALPDLKIHGHGDTDFQPVFTYLEKLITKGEIRQLRALLFFTDGDGIYPPTSPPFDTAFVFLNEAMQKQKIPDWGIQLNLNERFYL